MSGSAFITMWAASNPLCNSVDMAARQCTLDTHRTQGGARRVLGVCDVVQRPPELPCTCTNDNGSIDPMMAHANTVIRSAAGQIQETQGRVVRRGEVDTDTLHGAPVGLTSGCVRLTPKNAVRSGGASSGRSAVLILIYAPKFAKVRSASRRLVAH